MLNTHPLPHRRMDRSIRPTSSKPLDSFLSFPRTHSRNALKTSYPRCVSHIPKCTSQTSWINRQVGPLDQQTRQHGKDHDEENTNAQTRAYLVGFTCLCETVWYVGEQNREKLSDEGGEGCEEEERVADSEGDEEAGDWVCRGCHED